MVPSTSAITHYLLARLFQISGNLPQATEQLQKALLYHQQSASLHTTMAELYARQGRWDDALQEVETALRLESDLAEALRLKGFLLLRRGERSAARETFAKAVQADPHDLESAVSLAQLYLEEGDKKMAEQTLTRMIDANPQSAEGFRRLGDLAFERGDEKQAEEFYRRAMQLDAGDTRAIEVLTTLLERQGRYREAVRVFEEALAVNPENPSYLAYMGGLYLKMGDERTAEAYFEQVRSTDPQNASLIAYEYSRLNLYDRAIGELENLLRQNPQMHRERLLLGILYLERKQWEKAMQAFAHIPPTSAVFVNARINYGYCLLMNKRYSEAGQVLLEARQLAKKDEDIGRIYRYTAQIFAKTGQAQVGLEIIREARKQHQDNLDLIESEVDLLVEIKKPQEAEALLRQELEKKPGDVQLLYALGAFYEKTGDSAKSIEAMRQVVELEPNNYSALNFIGYTLADQGQDLDEAERLIRRALLLNPNNGAITDSLGWVLYQKGQYQKALELLLQADKISPQEPVIMMHVGDAYLKLGEKEKARDFYRRALQCDPEERDRRQLEKRLQELDAR